MSNPVSEFRPEITEPLELHLDGDIYYGNSPVNIGILFLRDTCHKNDLKKSFFAIPEYAKIVESLREFLPILSDSIVSDFTFRDREKVFNLRHSLHKLDAMHGGLSHEKDRHSNGVRIDSSRIGA